MWQRVRFLISELFYYLVSYEIRGVPKFKLIHKPYTTLTLNHIN